MLSKKGLMWEVFVKIIPAILAHVESIQEYFLFPQFYKEFLNE